jgi:hypothetical protein
LAVVIKLEARGTSWTIFNSRRTIRQIKAAAKIKKGRIRAPAPEQMDHAAGSRADWQAKMPAATV